MNKDNDTILLLKSQKGDKNAFETLFNKYYQKGLNVSFRILNSIENAEDVVMESFYSMYKLEINKDISFNSYFMRVVVNNSFNELKKNNRIVAEYNDQIMIENESDPAEIVENKVLFEDAQELLNQLPVNQKTALILVKYEGYSYNEAASIMNTTEKSVEALLWRARKKLNSIVGGNDNEL